MATHHRAMDEADVELIEHVKQTPSLYNPQHPDFRLPHRKEQDWERLAQKLGMSAMDARKRWTNLRERYSRELKQLRQHPENSEYGRNDFFRLMDFLRRFVRRRRERRRAALLQTTKMYNSSWVVNVEGGKLVSIKSKNSPTVKPDEEGVNEEEEEEEIHSIDEEDMEPEYMGKVETSQSGSAGYPEFVEVDAAETYGDYEEMESQPQPKVLSVKTSTPTLMPIALPQNNSTKYTSHLPQLKVTPQHAQMSTQSLRSAPQPPLHQAAPESGTETEDDFFCKSIAAYLRQLSRRHKIKAKVEMFQILEKYIELEESGCTEARRGQI